MDILEVIDESGGRRDLPANFGLDLPRQGDFVELKGEFFIVTGVLRKMQKDTMGANLIQWHRTVTIKYRGQK